MTKKQIKMRVVDWWNDDTEANFYANPFVKIVSQKCEICYSKKPDFLLCGPFGNKHLTMNAPKFFTQAKMCA